MNGEWAIMWTAVLVAGNLLGVVLIVRPLLKTVGALEKAVGAQKETIDAAKSLNEMTTATLSAIRPREVLQDVTALREMAELKAKDLIEQSQRKMETDRKELDKSRGSVAMLALMIFSRWVPAAERKSAITYLAESKPARDMTAESFDLLRAWTDVLDSMEAQVEAVRRARMGEMRVGLDPPPPAAPMPPPPRAS